MTELDFFKTRVEATMPPRQLMRTRAAEPEKVVLVDVRNATPDDMGEKILGAVHIPQSEIAGRLSELPKDELVIVYTWDDWCNLAARAAVTLLENGFCVMELRGGIAAWRALGFPTEKYI